MAKSIYKKGESVILAIVPRSSASRGIDMSMENIKNWTFNCTVKSVGSKYVTVTLNKYTDIKFEIAENYQQKVDIGSIDYELYKSIDDVYRAYKAQELYNCIKKKFDSYRNQFSLETLEKIVKLLEND